MRSITYSYAVSQHPLTGHRALRRTFAAAITGDRLPQLLLLTGPTGVGKQRLALWLAQLIHCASPADGEPCGTCQPCRLSLDLAHPDLHWFFPLPRPRGSEPDKQVVELEETLGEALTERRAHPLYGRPDGLAGHFMATAQLLARRAALTPAIARKKVIILAEAERLVPQAANPEAANALLKLFEEPPSDTWIILTASDLAGILPTIISRAVPVRVPPLPDADVCEFLRANITPTPSGAALEGLVARAQGCIGRVTDPEDDGARARMAADQLLAAVGAGAGARLERALAQGTFAARGEFTSLLDALADRLLDAVRARLGHPTAPLPPALERTAPEQALQALERVRAARDAAQGNVNPQLLLATLATDLAGVV